MKTKRMFYTALGYATFKTGKLFAKRRVRTAGLDWYRGRRSRIARRHT
jgi:hypothetical protein